MSTQKTAIAKTLAKNPEFVAPLSQKISQTIDRAAICRLGKSMARIHQSRRIDNGMSVIKINTMADVMNRKDTMRYSSGLL